MRRSGVGSWSHSCDIGRFEDKYSSRASAAAGGGDVHNHRNRRGGDFFDNLARGVDQTPGRIDLDQYSLIVAALGLIDGAGNVFARDGLNSVIDNDLEDFRGGGRAKNKSCRETEKNSGNEIAFHESLFVYKNTLSFMQDGRGFCFGFAGAGVLARPAGQISATGNQAGTAFVGEIRPRPLNKNQHSIAEADEKKNVDEEPCQPGHKTGDMNLAKLGDGCGAADGGEAAFVVIVKSRARRRFALNLAADELGDESCFENRNGRYAGQQFSR